MERIQNELQHTVRKNTNKKPKVKRWTGAVTILISRNYTDAHTKLEAEQAVKQTDQKLANLNASNIQLELNVCLLHVVWPCCEQTLPHVLVKVPCNKHIPGTFHRSSKHCKLL